MGSLKYYVGANGKPIKIGKLDKEKVISVVYNPNSGKKRNIRNELIEMFTANNLKYSFHETQGYMDAWRFARDCDIENLACIVAVGGDGTIHEVVNGLMYRKDKKMVPLAFIPNGSGNDTCFSLGVKSIDAALEGLRKGYYLEVDLIRCLMDAETPEELEGQPEIEQRMRFSISSSACGFLAKVTHRAAALKHWAGASCYLFAGLKQVFEGEKADLYKVTISNKLKTGEITNYVRYVQSQIIMIMNSRYCGGHIPLMPAALMNDGLLDFTVLQKPLKTSSVPSLYKEIISHHGRHVYTQGEWDYARGNLALIQNLNYKLNKNTGHDELVEQLFQVDGEGLKFTRQIKMENLCRVLPMVLDTETLLGLKPQEQA